MESHLHSRGIERNKNAQNLSSFENLSSKSWKFENQNKESFHTSDWETKASSYVSSGTHENSFDFSESSFENEQGTAEDFFREEFILEKKVTKKELTLREDCLNSEFSKHIEEILGRFSFHPSTSNFEIFLQQFRKINQNVLNHEEFKNLHTSAKLYSFKQVIESLIFERKNWFFIYTFDLLACHVTFFIVLISYWLNAQNNSPSPKYHAISNKDEKITRMSIRHNIISIIKAYVKSHPQEISILLIYIDENQTLFLLVVYFLDALKLSNPSETETLSNIQKDLVKDIKTFRRIQRKERNFLKSNNQIHFENKIIKFEDEHLLIASADVTYQFVRSHILENVSTECITKFYLDPEARRNYQLKKDTFCLWILELIMKDGENKSSQIQRNAAMYIVEIMGMLKKFKKENNIEAISYLLPIVANLKDFLPKVWKHVVKRRPEIELRLAQYGEFMLKNKFHVEELGQDGVIWGETIYTMAEKIYKCSSHKKGIDLTEHQRFYDQFLSQIFYYRHRSKQIVSETNFQSSAESEITFGFNFALLENHLIKRYSKVGTFESWKLLGKKAEKINESMLESVVADIFDYWFYGSTQKYQKVDL